MFVKHCPLCGYKGISFLSSRPAGRVRQRARDLKIPGDGFRRHVYCPDCGSVDSERLLFLYLLHQTQVFVPTAPPMSVLYVRPQPRLHQAIQRVSRVDLDSCDAHEVVDLPHESGRYDVIACDHVLERLPREQDALKRLHSMIHEDGQVIVQPGVSPVLPATLEDESLNTQRQRIRAYAHSERVRLYGQDIVHRLKNAGFHVQEFSWRSAGTRFGKVSNRYALPVGQPLYILRKPATHHPRQGSYAKEQNGRR